ncbi:MAG: sulfatase-like hydrolase/transferase [Polyangiaceae bacterium]
MAQSRLWQPERLLTGRPRWIVALAWGLLVLAPDVVVRGVVLARLTGWRKLCYVAVMLASLALWFATIAALRRVRLRSRPIFYAGLLAFAIFVPLWSIGALGYFRHFRADLSPEAWEFCLENPRYAFGLVRDYVTPVELVGLLFGPVALALLVLRTTGQDDGAARGSVWSLAPAAVALLVFLVALRSPSFLRRVPLPVDWVGLRAMTLGPYRHLRGVELKLLPTPQRAAQPPTPPARAPNVLLFVNESLGREQSAPWTPGGDTPQTAAFLQAHEGHAIWFSQAKAVANATAVALPSLLTGLAPQAPLAAWARAPLLWQVARAHGYRTALLSAQDFDYSRFGTYFLGDDGSLPDMHKVARDFTPAPFVNAEGVEDGLVIDDAIRFVRGTQSGDTRPFLLVVQFNATHWPCWAPDLSIDNGFRENQVWELAERVRRCATAARYVDQQTRRLLDELEHDGLLEQTLVIGTSDHGESFRADRPQRTRSFYEDVLSVPLWVHLPASATETSAQSAALRDNAPRRVSNLDIFPTILDVWGDRPEEWQPPLGGKSLLRPDAGEGSMLCLSSTEILDAEPGFALYHHEWKWIVDEEHGARLYDLSQDPEEQRDLSADAPAAEREALRAETQRWPQVGSVLRRVAPGFLRGEQERGP